MNFHLHFPIPEFAQKINYANKLLSVGSCFASTIGERLEKYKFNTLINPNGVLFNPASIAIALRRIIDNKAMLEGDLFFANECWNSWEHHSRFSHTDRPTCLTAINKSISSSSEFIKQADWLFITFGSAFVYKLNSSGAFVGNCHKVPQKEFTKQLLTVAEIVDDYTLLLKQLKAINSKLNIVFTVSPVRYIRDGVVENNISKARLIEAVHELVNKNNNSFYFPAYELVMDDLRDYRFYKPDLVHPNEQAIDYVFEKLMNTAFADETKKLFEKIKDIITAQQHRPFQTDTETYRTFQKMYFKRCQQIQHEYHFLDLKNEMESFQK